MDKETLIDYLRCATTPEQELAILDWLDADPANRRELDALGEVFNMPCFMRPCKHPGAGGRFRVYAKPQGAWAGLRRSWHLPLP